MTINYTSSSGGEVYVFFIAIFVYFGLPYYAYEYYNKSRKTDNSKTDKLKYTVLSLLCAAGFIVYNVGLYYWYKNNNDKPKIYYY